MKGFVHYHLL
uniref:Uncharacterized protein n=1 Tax=Anguilla anguilla TaxID=7936 RepID=A0A0E9VYD6_ANGAN